MFRTNFMVLGLDDIKFVDMTFIKAAYVKYHITGIWDMNHMIWFIWHTNSIICSINKGSLASRIEYAEHILSRFRPIQLLLPVQSPTTVHLPTVPTAYFVSENDISYFKNTIKIFWKKIVNSKIVSGALL